MKARDVMTRPVITVFPDTTVREAVARLAQHDIGSMPVVDGEDRLLGMISESDLLRDRLPEDAHASAQAHTVAQVMSGDVLALEDTAEAAEVAEAMLRRRVRAVPIVTAGVLVGIVSRQDLLRSLIRDDDVIADEVRDRLEAYAGGHGQWQVSVEDGAVTISGIFDDDAERRVITVLARTVPGVRAVHSTNRHLVP